MAKKAEIKAVISLDSSPFFRGINKSMAFAKAASRQFAKQPFKTTAIIGGLGGAGAIRGISAGLVGLGNVAATTFKYVSAVGLGAAAAFAAGAIGAIRLGGELDDLSNRTGQSVASVTILRKAFQLAGLGADQVGTLTNKLQKALSGVNEEGQPTNKEFQKLGLNIQALKQMDAVGQFQAIGNAINRIPDAADRAGAAMAIFGRGGGEVLQLFRDPNTFNQATESLGRQTGILQRNAAFFGAIEDKADRIKDKIQGFFVGVDDKIGLQLYALLDKLGSFDLARTGQQFGEGLKKGIDALYGAFKDPHELANFLEQAFDYGIKSGGNVLIAVFKAGVEFLKDGLIDGMVGIGAVITATLLEAFAKPIAYFQAGIEVALRRASGNDALTMQERVQLSNADEHIAMARQAGTKDVEAEWQARKDFLEKKRRDAGDSGKSVDEIAQDSLKNGVQFGGMNTKDMKDLGSAMAGASIDSALEKVRGIKINDELGAGASKSAMTMHFGALAHIGQQAEPEPTRRLNSRGVPYSDAELGSQTHLFGRQKALENVYGSDYGDRKYQEEMKASPQAQAAAKAQYAQRFGWAAANSKDRDFDYFAAVHGNNIPKTGGMGISPVSGTGGYASDNATVSLGYRQPGAGSYGYSSVFRGTTGLDDHDTRLTSGGLGGGATSTNTNGFDGNAFYQATGRIHGYSSMNTLRADEAKAGLKQDDPALTAQKATATNTGLIARALGESGTAQ